MPDAAPVLRVHAFMLGVRDIDASVAFCPIPVEIVLAVDGVGDAYEQLRARGVTFLNEPHSIDGTNDVANFEDPDGHLFSLYGAP
jgi:predicted enzyme related to lactoylglutathione lyase